MQLMYVMRNGEVINDVINGSSINIMTAENAANGNNAASQSAMCGEENKWREETWSGEVINQS